MAIFKRNHRFQTIILGTCMLVFGGIIVGSNGTSSFLIGSTSFKGPFLIAMLDYQSVIVGLGCWWLNHPSEKYARQNGFIFPQFLG